jgi:pilus assembly protein Flp/PilA
VVGRRAVACENDGLAVGERQGEVSTMETVKEFLAQRKDEGQTLVEYGLLLALIAVVVIGILIILGRDVSQIFSQVASALNP